MSFTEKHKTVDTNNRQSMIDFLTGHYRYDTMNSWNRSTSYAHNVKIHNLGIPEHLRDLAYELVCNPDVDSSEWDMIVNDLIYDFILDTGYSMAFNGRSGGYLVMYDAEYDPKQNRRVVYPGRSIDMYEDFEDWETEDIKERVELVKKFDTACEDIRLALIEFLETHEISETIKYVPVTERKFVPKDNTQ